MDPENRKPFNEHKIDDMDRVDQSTDSSYVSASSSVGEQNNGDSQQDNGSNNQLGLTQRLSNILVDQSDGDLLLQRSDREDRVIKWLQALDMHVMGACRGDERLKPLLKLNVSGGVAEDRLLAHLSQHFEPSEIGILAKCLCIPLVSIRVGKINKQGTLLCPTGKRGNLTLTLLPTSHLRITFIGDDGSAERLSTVSKNLHCSIAIEGIQADTSGRSFLINIPDGQIFYFWCSEKSNLLGNELLEKMKDLLKRKPSLSELSGISESRLGCFATYVRGYLVGSSDSSVLKYPEPCQNTKLPSTPSKPSRTKLNNNSNNVPFYQGSLSPRSSSFKEGLTRNLRSICKEKFRRRPDNHTTLPAALPTTNNDQSISNQSKIHKLPESLGSSLGISAIPPFLKPASSQVPSLTSSSLLSPYYCWCPLGAPSQQPVSSTESFSLPPPLNLSDLPSLDFPPFLPDPLMRLPLSMTNSQQIPTFTPLMCDPIVHIPVIDICSSGQGYLVSAGPSMTTGITPLIPETDSVVEKSARETLRLLLASSSQTSPQLISVLPSVLTECEEAQCVMTGGSRGLYGGVRDVGSTSADSSVAQLEKPTCSDEGPFVSKSEAMEKGLID